MNLLPWRKKKSNEVEKRNSPLAFQDWIDLFAFGGNNYPIVHQSWVSSTEEEIASTTAWAYQSNGPIFALILARMQLFSQIRFQWARFDKGQPRDLFGTESLRILERPWTGGTTSDLLARMELWASTAGTAFIRRHPDRLTVLNPNWCILVLGSDESADHPSEASDVRIVGLAYNPPNAPMVALEPFEFTIYAPYPDPERVFLGQSWITPVLRDIQGDTLATTHKIKFYENAATPNLAIKFDPTVGFETVKKFKEMVEEEHKGVWNAYKTLFLGGGADPMVVGADFKQMDFAVTQGKGESRMAAAAGVPPSWVGFSEGLQGSSLNAGNFTAQRRRFGDGTMHHLWANASASLEPLLRDKPGGAQLWYDTRGIPFFREDADVASRVQFQEMQTITGLIRDGYEPDAALQAVTTNDWTVLKGKHTGLLSVQLQDASKPGTPDQDGDGGTGGDSNDGATE